MTLEILIHWLERHRRVLTWSALPILVIMAAGVALLVYHTGGIKFVFAHSMYVPIVLGGLLFGLAGGLALGLLGGVMLGPFMPIDVVTGEMQQTINWLYRTAFFCVIGALAGGASDSVRWYVRRLRWTLCHESSTGLPNRTALVDEIDRRLSNWHDSQKVNEQTALVMLSLENADELTVGFGTDACDDLMLELAERLRQDSETGLPVFRINRSRLCVLVVVHGGDDAQERFDHISEKVVDPFHLDGLGVHGDFRLGMVMLDQSDSNPQEALKRAEAALVMARGAERNLILESWGVETSSRENIALLGQLRRALRGEQLELHYQPKIELSSGRVTGVEALMRWYHPEDGLIPPGKFIPRAEQSTLIDELTDYAIGRALDQLLRWRSEGIDLCMAVNISARNLASPGFNQMVREHLASRELDGECLELEVTEGALMIDIDKVAQLLHGLAGLRVVMSIDDFGTGYSSLQYMNDLPVSIIKIDQAFILPLPGDDGSEHIVGATIDLAHRLNMGVVAEGVESRSCLDLLTSMGCDMGQGYHIARPMPATEFGEWYRGINGRFGVAVAP